MDDYERLHKMGDGAQGSVYRVKHRKTGKEYALKVIRCKDHEQVNYALKEIKVLIQLRHPHIVSYIDFFLDIPQQGGGGGGAKQQGGGGSRSPVEEYPGRPPMTGQRSASATDRDIRVCLVMSLCDHGDLQGKVREAKQQFMTSGAHPLPEALVVRWLKQCAEALSYIHHKGFLHRDVKPTNVFFLTKDDITLGDFGLATSSANGGLSKQSQVGTPYYFAPELMLNESYNQQVDVWGLGVVFYELLSLRERPLNSEALQSPKSIDGIVEQMCEMGFSTQLAGMVRSMLNRQPEDRPTPLDIVQFLSPAGSPPAEVMPSPNCHAPKPQPASRTSGSRSQSNSTRTLCDMCSEEPSEVHCTTCKEFFCRRCDVSQHRNKSDHHRVPATPSDKACRDQDAVRCVMCDVFAAVKSCAECGEGEYFCFECDAVKHRNPRRSGHIRLDFAATPETGGEKNERLERHRPAPIPFGLEREGSKDAIHRDPSPLNAAGGSSNPMNPTPPSTLSTPTCSVLVPTPTTATSGHASGASTSGSPQFPSMATMQRSGSSGGFGTDCTNAQPSTSTKRVTPPQQQAPGAGTEKGSSRPSTPNNFVPINVPQDFRTITEALNHATTSLLEGKHMPLSNYKIFITDGGTYHESLRISVGSSGGGATASQQQGARLGRTPQQQQVTGSIHIIGKGSRVPTIISEGSAAVFINTGAGVVGRIENLCLKQVRGRKVPALATSALSTATSGAQQQSETRPFALDIRGGYWTITQCRISSEGGNCVGVSGAGSDPTVTHCSIQDGRQAGIFVFDEAKGLFQENTIENCEHTGILLKRKANPRFVENVVRTCSETGIFCHDSTGSFDGNTVADNKGCGVVLKGGADPTFRRNTVSQNGQAGIFCCDNALGKLVDNIVVANVRAGLLIKTGANPTVQRNTFTKGKETGVYVFEKGEGIIEDNTIERNGNAGVLVTTGGNPRVHKNRLKNNAYEGIWVCKLGQGTYDQNQFSGNVKGAKDIDGSSLNLVQWGRDNSQV